MIEMPDNFRDIYKYREGEDKFFFDKIKEIVETVNGVNENKKGKVNISVKDDNNDGVENAKIKLSAGSNTIESNATGTAGGTTLNNVPYGTYSVSVIAPTGYTALTSYSNLNVNADTVSLNVTVNKNTTIS